MACHFNKAALRDIRVLDVTKKNDPTCGVGSSEQQRVSGETTHLPVYSGCSS
jgi:hypothetical protein